MLECSLAAFAFSRLNFRGRDTLFMTYLATLMIPFPVLLIPNFLIVREFGWYDTYMALILPPAFSAIATFLYRQAFKGIPKELDDAARIDGAFVAFGGYQQFRYAYNPGWTEFIPRPVQCKMGTTHVGSSDCIIASCNRLSLSPKMDHSRSDYFWYGRTLNSFHKFMMILQ